LLAGCSTEVVEAGPEVADPPDVVVVTEAPPNTAPPDVPDTTAPLADAPRVAFAIGDCLTWDQAAPTAVFETIDCAEAHLAEVAGLLDLSEVYPPDADLPTIEELVQEGSAACPDIVVAYLGGEPGADIEGGVLVPTAGDWALGNRTWVCTVGFARQDGRRPAYTGRLAQDDAELVAD
jgi:hypothetical protein